MAGQQAEQLPQRLSTMVQLMAHFQQQQEQVMILQVGGQVKLVEAKSLQQQSSKQQITIKQFLLIGHQYHTQSHTIAVVETHNLQRHTQSNLQHHFWLQQETVIHSQAGRQLLHLALGTQQQIMEQAQHLQENMVM